MRTQVSDGLVQLYERATRAGLLDRPLPRHAFESTYLAYKRMIEAGPINGMRNLVRHGSTVVDVGANIGFFSVRFARWVGPAGRVIAIHRPAIYVEVDPVALGRLGSSPRELIETVVEFGYAGRRLTSRGIGARMNPDELIARSSSGYIDVLFLPDGAQLNDG